MKIITAAALVCLLPGQCPSCGGKLEETTTWQPALFVACDYGAATATTVRRCHGCGWWIATGQQTVESPGVRMRRSEIVLILTVAALCTCAVVGFLLSLSRAAR